MTQIILALVSHHPLGGRIPATLFEGLMSGFGHPVIGVDHCAAVVAIGALAFVIGRRALPAFFVGGTLLGTAIHLQALDLPIVEIVIASSVLLFGIFLLLNRRPAPVVLYVIGAFAGTFHGYAYGEAIVGAEPTPMAAYLIGFAAIQLAISFGAYVLVRALSPRIGELVARRAVGALASLVGVWFLIG